MARLVPELRHRPNKTFVHNGLRLNFMEQNEQGNPAAVFLHGWLDHCHSFDWVWDELPAHWRLIGLDFRGHGKSAHIPKGGLHHFFDYLVDVEGLFRHLGRPFHAIGHSLGGSVALMYAAARPEAVLSLTVIESLGPTSDEPKAIIRRLRNFLEDSDKPARKRIYPTIDAALARVRENNSSLSEAAARHMTTYGLKPVDSGFEFTFDSVLRRRNIFPFTEEQMSALLKAVQCPVMVLHATHGLSYDDEQMKRRLASLRVVSPIVLEGGHHIHLDQPSEVAAHIKRFVEGSTSPSGARI